MTRPDPKTIRTAVRDRYAAIARAKLDDPGATMSCAAEEVDAQSCCAPTAEPASCCGPAEGAVATTPASSQISSWVETLYEKRDLEGLDEDLTRLSLGCGNPTSFAEFRAGDTVLDLGSGAGLDCFLAAKAVGPEGRVIGVDMTDDMLALAQRNQTKLRATNVEFHKGVIEELPVDSASVDVIVSNCVINLAPDKAPVLAEAARVLKPGGRFRVSDIVWLRPPTPAEQGDLSSWAGCVAGALTADEYRNLLADAGFTDIAIDYPAEAADNAGWASASIRATRS